MASKDTINPMEFYIENAKRPDKNTLPDLFYRFYYFKPYDSIIIAVIMHRINNAAAKYQVIFSIKSVDFAAPNI